MISKLSLSAATLAAAFVFVTLPTSATTIGGLAPLKSVAGQQQSLIEKTHGWHRTCKLGLNGWHKHVPGVGRVQCTNKKDCYYDFFGVQHCTWF